MRQTERPQRLEPFVEQIAHQAPAHYHPDGLIEPRLADVEYQQYACQLGEYTQLSEKRREILARQRVVERLVPGVESGLHVRRSGNDHDETNGEEPHLLALA